MVLVFFGTENRNGIKCTIYKIQVNFSLSLDLKPGTGNPNKWYKKFHSVRLKKSEKGNTSKGITFFPENFHRDEPFHLNSPRKSGVFNTNDERSKSSSSAIEVHLNPGAFLPIRRYARAYLKKVSKIKRQKHK